MHKKKMPEEFHEDMQDIAEVLEQIFDGFGFALFIFPFDDGDGDMLYLSNAQRKDVAEAMKAFIRKHEHDVEGRPN